MSTNRIQKLLFSEYSDFEDMVLVESPFAQTTRDGQGIRQVSLGLTPTKLILATDYLPSAKESCFTFVPGLDPEIETFELVAIYPVEALTLSVFHRNRKQSLKARFCNDRVFYFELGGFDRRQMFWNLWCERLKFLNPVESGSSKSETSVATSTSNSTLYLVATKKIITQSGVSQLWCKFGAGISKKEQVKKNVSSPRWTDRYLYLGKNLEEPPVNYTPAILPPTISQFLGDRPTLTTRLPRYTFSLPSSTHIDKDNEISKSSSCNKGTNFARSVSMATESAFGTVNRFGMGIPDNCKSNLRLMQGDSGSIQKSLKRNINCDSSRSRKRLFAMEEQSVSIWEKSRQKEKERGPGGSRKHTRRYAIAPQPHFLSGLGPWSIPPGDRVSVQLKRASSLVMVRRQPLEPELRLPLSKRQLIASVSCENLYSDKLRTNTNTLITTLKRPVIFFWTPDYWYRPCSPRDAYQDMLKHLNSLREYCQKKSRTKYASNRRRFFRKKKEKVTNVNCTTDSENDSEETKPKSRRNKNRNSLKIFSPVAENFDEQFVKKERKRRPQETSLAYLKRTLRTDIVLTAWDFDSTTLACQLTLIDRDLFLKIPHVELKVLMSQKSSKNAPNVGALQAFSHRISCLIATEIIRNDSEKIRARLIARLINTAEKCHKISNFQSCKSILNGLQSPSIYRLHLTWSYVRKRHATKYRIFENLCRLYRDPRLPAYQAAFLRASEERPFLPYLGDVVARLLCRATMIRVRSSKTTLRTDEQQGKIITTKSTTESTNTSASRGKKLVEKSSAQSMIQRFLSSLKVVSPSKNAFPAGGDAQYTSEQIFHDPNIENLFEQSKLARLNCAVDFLENGQRAASAYILKVNPMARDFLLKARYREERENFMNSFSMEKPRFAKSNIHHLV